MTHKLSRLWPPVFFAIFMIPIDDQNQWQILSYRSIPPNQAIFASDGLRVDVKNSSSPLIYPLSRPTKIKKITLSAQLIGGVAPRIPGNVTQGDKGFDDFALRLGLVKLGTKRLNWVQRQLAPDWLVNLYKLLPSGIGVDGIRFFAVASNAKDIGMKRKHPLNEIFEEEIVTSVQPDGKIRIEQSFKEPVTTLAIWVGIDGDDTGSTYQIHISEITLSEEI